MSANNSFVRKEMISERVPPAAERGLVKWVRENLFSSAFNTIINVHDRRYAETYHEIE